MDILGCPTPAGTQTQASLSPRRVLISLVFAASTKSGISYYEIINPRAFLGLQRRTYFSADWTRHRNNRSFSEEKFLPFLMKAGRAICQVRPLNASPPSAAVSQARLQEVADVVSCIIHSFACLLSPPLGCQPGVGATSITFTTVSQRA